MAEDNEIKKQGGGNNYAMIWNYYNQVGEVKNYFGEAASKDDLAEPYADKQKRQELLRTNRVLRLNFAPNDRMIDVLRLFRFTEKYFVEEIKFKYEWYALRRFLEKHKLLLDCDNVAFAEQMNRKEWYGHAHKSCEPNEMNNYNFLKDITPEMWLSTKIPIGSNATKSALNGLYRCYYELENNKEELVG
jgi:hypothetical protein